MRFKSLQNTLVDLSGPLCVLHMSQKRALTNASSGFKPENVFDAVLSGSNDEDSRLDSQRDITLIHGWGGFQCVYQYPLSTTNETSAQKLCCSRLLSNTIEPDGIGPVVLEVQKNPFGKSSLSVSSD